MIWLSFSDTPAPEDSTAHPEDKTPEDASATPRKSLFGDDDGDESLHSADLETIDATDPRAGGGIVEPGEEEQDEFDDAVDEAAAEASMAYVEEHGGEDGLPEPETPATPVEWLVPWVISALAHVALVVVAVFVVWSVREALQDDKVIIPLVNLSETPGAPLEVKVQQRVETQQAAPAPAPAPTPTPLEADIDLELELPGIGEPAADAPTFELALDDAAQFDTNFYGSGGNAKDIVFVVEADGSIISDYPQIVGELATTLRGMSEKQKFSVVVFDGEGVKEVPPRGLRRATADAKASAIAWLHDTRNVQNMGSGDAVKALDRAFRLRPELIFLLSQNLYNPGRGKYELQREEVLDAVRKSPQRNVTINTIEFNDIDRLALDPQGNKVRLTLLEEIAKMTGGEYIWIVTNVPDASGN